jgi:hypothetical protein
VLWDAPLIAERDQLGNPTGIEKSLRNAPSGDNSSHYGTGVGFMRAPDGGLGQETSETSGGHAARVAAQDEVQHTSRTPDDGLLRAQGFPMLNKRGFCLQ